jgi:hypothetical protein
MFEPPDGYSPELRTFEHPAANNTNLAVMGTFEVVVRLDQPQVPEIVYAYKD